MGLADWFSTFPLRASGPTDRFQVPFNDGITFEVVPGFVNRDESYTHTTFTIATMHLLVDQTRIREYRDRDAIVL